MAGRFSVEAVFKAVDRVTAPVSRMQNRVGKLTRSMGRGFDKLNRSVGKFTAGVKKAGKGVAVAGAIFGALGFNVLAAGANFEQAITDVGAVSLQTRKQIEPLEQLALQLGRSTKFTSTQAANAMEVMARAGFKANEILTATPAVLSAAAASGLEIAEVANHVSNVLKGMGLETAEAARVSDVLALASARTNSSIGSLGESMKNVASTAKQLNVPLEQVVAGVALLQDVGLDASVAGSAFNTMLTKMAAPTTAMQKKMRRLGISFKDSKGDMLPLTKVLDNLNKASRRVGGNFDKVAFLAELVGLRGQKAAANLGELFETGKLTKLTKELEKAKGAADEMARLRMDTFQGSMLLLGSAVDAVKVRIFGLNNGPLKDVVDNMTKWVSANEALIATNVGEFIAKIITNLPAIIEWVQWGAKAAVVFIAFVTVLKTLIGVLTLVNLLMTANPITLIVLAVVAAIAAFTALVIWIDEVAEAFGKMNPFIRAILAPLELVVRTIKFIKDAFKGGFGDAISKLAVSLGFDVGSETDPGASAVPQVVSPQERVARSIEEQRTTSSAEVTIRDESGRAEVTSGSMGPGLSLQPSGAF